MYDQILHFGSKEGLFQAVLDAVHAEVGRRVASEADAARDPWQALLARSRAFLEAATAPDVRRIMLLDGPAVLGRSAWRELDARHSMKHLREHLGLLKEAGIVVPVDSEALAYLLSGAVNEAALWIAAQPDREDALGRAVEALGALLEGMRR